MNEEVKTIRNNIVRKFCRTVLWIDDEIHLDQGLAAKGTPALFQNKFDEFTRSGLLCHMMGFPEIRPGSDPVAPQSKLDEVNNSIDSLKESLRNREIEADSYTKTLTEYALEARELKDKIEILKSNYGIS